MQQWGAVYTSWGIGYRRMGYRVRISGVYSTPIEHDIQDKHETFQEIQDTEPVQNRISRSKELLCESVRCVSRTWGERTLSAPLALSQPKNKFPGEYGVCLDPLLFKSLIGGSESPQELRLDPGQRKKLSVLFSRFRSMLILFRNDFKSFDSEQARDVDRIKIRTGRYGDHFQETEGRGSCLSNHTKDSRAPFIPRGYFFSVVPLEHSLRPPSSLGCPFSRPTGSTSGLKAGG